jgi:hypothetical protein
VGGRRPPWIGCKLCSDLNEIFLVCILSCVGSKSEIFSCVHHFDLSSICLPWSPARFSSPGADPFWHVHELAFHSSLGPGPSPVFFSGSRTRVLSFLLFFRVVRRHPSGLGIRCRVLFSAGFRAASVSFEFRQLLSAGAPCEACFARRARCAAVF